jgi:GNAT superfamily N-acetyltransferase
MHVLIRRATLSDADRVAELYVRARRASAIAGAIPQPVHNDEEIALWVTNHVVPKLDLWLAERASGALAGMLALDNDWIDQLFVDPELTRLGIGGQLIAAAKRERPDGLRLWTFVSNENAQHFYLRHGFQEVERTDGSQNEEGAPDIQYAWAPA